jgi:predicted MPP superfamily phosphohydrolase
MGRDPGVFNFSRIGNRREMRFLVVCRRAVPYGRVVILLLILVLAIRFIAQGIFFGLFLLGMLLIFIASQIFWIARVLDWGERFLPGRPRRSWLAIVVVGVYLFVVIYSYPQWALGHGIRASDYRLRSILIHAAFWWWFVGSMLAFSLILAFAALDRAARAAAWMGRKARRAIRRPIAATDSAVVADPPSSGRRRFLQQTAVLVSATPFVAAGYGLLYERVNVEIVRQRIRLARLPKAFEGFRIAQLSDLHISPFSTAAYIRHCVAMTNGLNPDLIALTGDYVAWDPQDQGEAVRALAGLRAPHGVFGCLGNHEEATGIEDSITQVFAAQGIRILRQERAPIRLDGEMLNLIGLDEPHGDLYRRLHQLQGLVMPDTVNILLIHYPYFFGRPGLGIDLTLAGDLHGGGQLSLDSLHRGLNLSRLLGLRYVRGRHEIAGAQLYLNRGIGTTGFPIRLGARPEITLLELTTT